MPTDWIRQHVKPSLVARYEREMSKLRGGHCDQTAIEENIKQLNVAIEQMETEEELRARELAENEEEERFYQQRKSKE